MAYLGAGLAGARCAAHRRAPGDRAGLRRRRRHPAHRPLTARWADQPGPRPGPAQAVLRLLRLRTAGRGRRRHRRPLTRAPTQLSAPAGPVDAPERLRPRHAGAGRAAPPHAGRPLAVEPQPGARRPPVARRVAPPDPPAAHGGRGPAGRRLARPGRLPGERRSRSGGGAGPRARAPDGRRLPDRAARRRRSGGPPHLGGGRTGDRALRRVGRTFAPGTRDPDRQALHLPRRCAPRGAPHPGRGRAPRARRTGPDGLPPGLPVPAGELAAFDQEAQSEVLGQIRPAPRDPDELHDLLLALGGAARCRTGGRGSTSSWPTVGPAPWAATGRPPSDGPRPSWCTRR